MVDKGLDYAESQLGVHTVYNEVISKRNELDECLTRLSEKRDERRAVEAQIEERQIEITTDEYGKHADMTVSGMDRHLKQIFGTDGSLHELREKLRMLINEIEGLDYDRSITETDIKIGLARLQELGGYLMYLAAIKTAKSSTPKMVSDNIT